MNESMTIPTPRYQIGDVVYSPRVESVTRAHACPDCLGSQKWTCTSPAGGDFTLPCQRCASGYRRTNVPSLEYFEYAPSAKRLTIGKIDITTAPWSGDCKVKYMCKETGIGSGQTYNERLLFASEDEALAIATGEALEKNLAKKITPERMEQQHFSEIEFKIAELEATESALWNAWYAYRHLKEDIEEAIKDLSDADREPIEDVLRWEKEHRPHPPLDVLLESVQSAIDGDLTALRAAYKGFPQCFAEAAKALQAA